jgi:hypothetical protein
MANVTFIIGNGFDLKMGLKTRYTDFYKVYTKIQKKDDELIRWFKRTILLDEENGWKNWSDFELGMGKQSDLFDGNFSAGKFLKCINDFVIEFHKYLYDECQKVDRAEITGDIVSKLSKSLLQFKDKLYASHKTSLEAAMEDKLAPEGILSFLQFNYTDLFDILIDKLKNQKIVAPKFWSNIMGTFGVVDIGQNLHLHGSLVNYPIMGVDSAEQIGKFFIRNDDNVNKVFVKQNYLAALHNRVINTPNPTDLSIPIIKNSDIICAFGTSIGETDRYWWELVGDWLKNDGKYLVVFDVCGENDDGISPESFLLRDTIMATKEEEILLKFAKLANFNNEELDEIRPRILIELDRPMFDFKLPMKNTFAKTFVVRHQVDPDATPPQEEKPPALLGV